MKISSLYDLSTKEFNVDISKYISISDGYIKYITDILEAVKKRNEALGYAEFKASQINRQLDLLYRAFCRGESFNPIGAGKNTGMHNDDTFERHEQILGLEQELKNKTAELSSLLDSSRIMNDLIEQLINSLPQDNYAVVLKYYYLESVNIRSIADRLNISPANAKKRKQRGIEALSKLIQNMEKTQKN